MELALNLFWLLLALPAYWLWRSEVPSFAAGQRFKRLRTVLVLGSVLMLLFPIVSATDDLYAMRPEMEESSGGKRTFTDGGSDKARIGHSNLLVAEWNPPVSFAPADHVFGRVVAEAASIEVSVLLTTRFGRAPPRSLLA